MSAHITIQEAEVRRLANLARLSITDEEVLFFQKDIESILGFIDTIQEVSLPEQGESHSEGFAPVGHIRSDEIRSVPTGATAEELVRVAPAHTDNAVKVKKILA